MKIKQSKVNSSSGDTSAVSMFHRDVKEGHKIQNNLGLEISGLNGIENLQSSDKIGHSGEINVKNDSKILDRENVLDGKNNGL